MRWIFRCEVCSMCHSVDSSSKRVFGRCPNGSDSFSKRLTRKEIKDKGGVFPEEKTKK